MVRIISIFKLDELKIHFQTYKMKNNRFDAKYNNFATLKFLILFLNAYGLNEIDVWVEN